MKVRPKSAIYFFILFGSAKIVVAEERKENLERYIEEINQNLTKTFDAATNGVEIEKSATSRKVFNVAKNNRSTPISRAQLNKSHVEIRSNKNVNNSLQNRVIQNNNDSHSKVEINSKQDKTGNVNTSTFPFKVDIEQKLTTYGRSNQLEKRINAPKYEKRNPTLEEIKFGHLKRSIVSATNQPKREVKLISKDTSNSQLEESIVIDNNSFKENVEEKPPIVKGLEPKYEDIIGIKNKSPYSDIKNNFNRMTKSETQFYRGTNESTYGEIESKSFGDDTVSENLNKDDNSDDKEDAKNKKIVDALLKSNSFVKQLSHLLRQMVLSAHLNVPTIPDNKTSTSCIQTDNITIIQTDSKQDTAQLQEENKKIETNLMYLKENVAKLENQLEDFKTRLVLLENHLSNDKQNKEDFDKNILKLFMEQNLKIIKDNENLKNTIKILELNIKNQEIKFDLAIKNQSEKNQKQIDQMNDKLKSFNVSLIETTKKGLKYPTEDSIKMPNEDVETLIKKTVKITLKNLLKRIKNYIENGKPLTNQNIDDNYGTSSEEVPLTKPNYKPTWYMQWAQEFAKHKPLLGQKWDQINTRMSNPTSKYINIEENRSKDLKVDYEDPSERNLNSKLEEIHPRNKIDENSDAMNKNNKISDNRNINNKKQEDTRKANNEIITKNPENHHNEHKKNIQRYKDNNKELKQNDKDNTSGNKGYIDRGPEKNNHNVDKNKASSQKDEGNENQTENTIQIPNMDPDEIENSGNRDNNNLSMINEEILGHYEDKLKIPNMDPKKMETSYDKYTSQKNKDTASSNKDKLKLPNTDQKILELSRDREKNKNTKQTNKENLSHDKDKSDKPIRDSKPLENTDNDDKNESSQKNIGLNKNKLKMPNTGSVKIKIVHGQDINKNTHQKTEHYASHNKKILKIPNTDPEQTDNSANKNKNEDTSQQNATYNKNQSKISNMDPQKMEPSYDRDKNKEISQKTKENIGHNIDELKIPNINTDKMDTSHDINKNEDTRQKSDENSHNKDKSKLLNKDTEKNQIFHSRDKNKNKDQNNEENIGQNKDKLKISNINPKIMEHSHDRDKNISKTQKDTKDTNDVPNKSKVLNIKPEKIEHSHNKKRHENENQKETKNLSDEDMITEKIKKKSDKKANEVINKKGKGHLNNTHQRYEQEYIFPTSEPEKIDHSKETFKNKVKAKMDKENLNKNMDDIFSDLKKIEDSRKNKQQNSKIDKENANNSKDMTEIIDLNPKKMEHSDDKYKKRNTIPNHKGMVNDNYGKTKLSNINAGNIDMSTQQKDEYIKDENQEHYSTLTESISENKDVTEANYLKKLEKSANNTKKNTNLNQTEQENVSNNRDFNELSNIKFKKINNTDYDSLLNKKESLKNYNKLINLNSDDIKLPDNGNYKILSNLSDTASSLGNNNFIKKYLQMMEQLKTQKGKSENIKLGKKEEDEPPHITDIEKDHSKGHKDDDITLINSNLGKIYSRIQNHISQIKKIRPKYSNLYNLDHSGDGFSYISEDGDDKNLDNINFMNQYNIPQKTKYNLNHHGEPNSNSSFYLSVGRYLNADEVNSENPNYLSKNNKRPPNTIIFQNHRKEPIESSFLYNNEPRQSSSNTRPKNKNVTFNHKEPNKNKTEQINLGIRTKKTNIGNIHYKEPNESGSPHRPTNPRYSNSRNHYKEPNGSTQEDMNLDNLNVINKKYVSTNIDADIGIKQYKEGKKYPNQNLQNINNYKDRTKGGFPHNLNFMNNKYVPQIQKQKSTINNRYKEPSINNSPSLTVNAYINSDEFNSGNPNYIPEINQTPFNMRDNKNGNGKENSTTKALTLNIIAAVPATDTEQYTENPLEISGIKFTENPTKIKGFKNLNDKDNDTYKPVTFYTNSADFLTDKDQDNNNPTAKGEFEDFRKKDNSKEEIIYEDDKPDINVFKKFDNLLFQKSLGNKGIKDHLSIQKGSPKQTKFYDNYVLKSVNPNKNKHTMKTGTIGDNYKNKNKYINKNSNDNLFGYKEDVYNEYNTEENHNDETFNYDNSNKKQTVDLKKNDTHSYKEPEELHQDYNKKNTNKYLGNEHKMPTGFEKYENGNKNATSKIINPKHNKKVNFDSDYYNKDNIENFDNTLSQNNKKKQKKAGNYQIYTPENDNSIEPIYNFEDSQQTIDEYHELSSFGEESDEKPKIKSKRHYKNSRRRQKKKKNKRRKHIKHKNKVKSTHTIQRPNLKAERDLPSLKFVISKR